MPPRSNPTIEYGMAQQQAKTHDASSIASALPRASIEKKARRTRAAGGSEPPRALPGLPPTRPRPRAPDVPRARGPAATPPSSSRTLSSAARNSASPLRRQHRILSATSTPSAPHSVAALRHEPLSPVEESRRPTRTARSPPSARRPAAPPWLVVSPFTARTLFLYRSRCARRAAVGRADSASRPRVLDRLVECVQRSVALRRSCRPCDETMSPSGGLQIPWDSLVVRRWSPRTRRRP